MASKKSGSGAKSVLAAAKKAATSVSSVGSENSSTLPTPEDAKLLAKTPVPAPTTDRVFHSISDAFTARVGKFTQGRTSSSSWGAG